VIREVREEGSKGEAIDKINEQRIIIREDDTIDPSNFGFTEKEKEDDSRTWSRRISAGSGKKTILGGLHAWVKSQSLRETAVGQRG